MAASRSTRSEPAVQVRRLLPAAPEEIFRARTDPDLLRQWMTPVGTAVAAVDLQVGGRFRVVMSGDGREIEHTGEYREISPPDRLVFTWRSWYTGDEPSLVTVVLHSRGPETELVLTHELLPPGAVEPHAGGWGRMLDRLLEILQGIDQEG